MNDISRIDLQDGRRTIGLVVDDITQIGGQNALLGVTDVARERDVNLICFRQYLYQRNGIPVEEGPASLGLLDQIIDGLVIYQPWPNEEAFADFRNRFPSLPMVNVLRLYEGCPALAPDSYWSTKELTSHLIKVHGCRRIAFVAGPETWSVEQRYRGYVDALAEHDLPLDPDLVTPHLTWAGGSEAILLLIDERGLLPGTDFEAVVASNDSMAQGAIYMLQDRGVQVPKDVAVVGFDDIPESSCYTPPMTTARIPAYEMGRRATEILLMQLAGEQVPEQTLVPPRIMIRHSCGCLDPAVVQAAVGPVEKASETWETALAAHREHILAEMAQAVDALSARMDPDWSEHLLDAFLAVLKDGALSATGLFLHELEDTLRQMAATEKDAMVVLQGTLSALRRCTLPYLDGEALSLAQDLWQQARVAIGQAAMRLQEYQALQTRARLETLRGIESVLITTIDIDQLVNVLADQLPSLDIPGCYLALYEDAQSSLEWARLVLAYDEANKTRPRGRIELKSDGQRFRVPELMPQDVWPQGRRYSFLVEPLAFRKRPLGFVLFELGPREGIVYHVLQGQLSSALQGTLLVRQVQEANYATQRRAIQLEASAEVGRAITSIFDIDELLQQTIALISDRFGFYHVGIFLIDKTGQWAILREATGEAGAQMKSEGHRLAVGDTSMVGWTAAHRQPRIALDVGEDAVRFAHPLLPYTRSEMTLPLMVGDRLLGVLNVQSTEEAAFDQDDVRTLQGMADQVAIAIQNAQRMADEGALLEVTSPVYRTSRLLTTATTRTEVADAIIASVRETGVDGCLVVKFEFSPTGEPEALLYLGVWRRDREPQFQAGLRLPIAESPFPLEMVSTLWTVADVNEDDRLPRSARVVFQATGARALVNIPLRSGERVIGQVVVIRATPGPFNEAALRLYEVLSDQAAVALERAELLGKAQQRAERELQARRMIDHIRRAVDLEQALEIAAQELSQAMQVPHVSIDLGIDAIKQE